MDHYNVIEKKYTYKDLFYDLDLNEFFYKNNKIYLTKNNKYLLLLFFLNQEKLLTDKFLIEKIRGDVCFIINRNLRVNILRLKKGLSKFGIDNWIQNIRGEGYILKGE